MGRPLEFDSILANSFIFGSAMVIIGTFTFEMGRLLGFGTLKNLLTGRYAQPRREQKVFLLIDMKDSTGLAERLGPIRFHELLNTFFADIADAARVPAMVAEDCLLMLRDAKLLASESRTGGHKPARPIEKMTAGELWSIVDLHTVSRSGEPDLRSDPAARQLAGQTRV